ncbi:UpxY family transcription antiterminator [Aquirufa nivalisilvae]|uniref:UpxY family transcription antiterminator n=1 Tax=Aquirufa nivalisilvae TaxID=2516557 RepID=UPI0010329D09|nr:UpxY family transcription antiterminator [Aquirufa nivalisilvae]TBH76355.1 UpxY family transcription antiterminator [Aquirufa nivalisilvae]
MAWYALYTKSRVEKKVALRLKEQGITCYCPVSKKRKQWSDRKKWVEEPLFKSYVFVDIDLASQSSQVRQVNGVVNFVYWLHKPAVVQDSEITAIQNFLSEHSDVEAIDNVIKIGDFVTLDTGALAGQKAEVLGFKNKHEVRLRIDSLGFELVAYINQS